MVFFIKQFATLPKLKMSLFHDGRNDFEKVANMLENAVITFAMKEESTGIYQVANKMAQIVLQDPCDINSKKEYYISYTFTDDDTEKPGVYIGEFKITFLNQTMTPIGDLIMPIGENLYIHILDSFVKSDITYIS